MNRPSRSLMVVHFTESLPYQVRLLQPLLKEKFGELSDWAEKKIEMADVAKLEKWTLQVIEAERLVDILPKPHSTHSRNKR